MGLFGAVFGLTRASASHGMMKREQRRESAANAANRGLVDVGKVDASALCASFDMRGDRLLIGGRGRRDALVGALSVSQPWPAAMVSIGAAATTASDGASYDPVAACPDGRTAALLVADALGCESQQQAASVTLFVESVFDIARRGGTAPRLTTLLEATTSIAPFFDALASLENAGRMTPLEGDRLQRGLSVSRENLVELAVFLQVLQREQGSGGGGGGKASWSFASGTAQGRSSALCVGRRDSNMARLALAELKHLRVAGRRFLLVVDGAAPLSNDDPVAAVLSVGGPWVVSVDDLAAVFAGAAAPSCVASCDGVLLIGAHSPASSSAVSEALGSYEHVDVTSTRGGSGGFQGRLGFSHQGNDSFSKSLRRASVVPPEMVARLCGSEFILAPASDGYVYKGSIL